MKRITALLISIPVIFIAACTDGTGSNSEVAPTSKVGIVASFYPLAEFARQVGGDKVAVDTVVPAGIEPHDFEPTPQDIAGINKAALFIYNGGSLDPWAGKVNAELSPLVKVLDMSSLVDCRSDDPHFWLDPVFAQKEVEIIRDALISADHPNAETYRQNAASYLGKLQALDREFASTLSSCANREIFTSHAAFSYLAARYGLKQSSIAGFSPDAEPSARQLAALADEAKARNIRYIFFETLSSSKLADTLSAEVGAQTLVLNPLEGLTSDEVKSGMDYISVMRQNLANLKLALECR
jgi:zinc transport system substrate-binding protein